MGYFYSTSVSILDGTLVSKMGHLHMASCDAGRFTPQIWGFSFDPQREDYDQPRGHNLLCQRFECAVWWTAQQRINNGVAGLDSVLQSRPLGDF